MDLSRVAAHEPVRVADEEREAGVLAPLLDRGPGGTPRGEAALDPDAWIEPAVLFTKRADHLGEHAGQMSWPGGGHEPGDDGRHDTALREADEEIGLAPAEVETVGRLDDIRTVTRYAVSPFVATVPDRAYEPGDGEVAEIAVLPLADLLDRANYDSERRDHPHYGDIRLHYFRVDGYTVWGATARMLVQLLELATDWEMPPEVDRVVEPDADFPV